MVIVAGHITVDPEQRESYRNLPQQRPQQQATRGNALGVGSRVRHRRCAALVRKRQSVNLQHGPCHDR
jgi:hypothetical protein